MLGVLHGAVVAEPAGVHRLVSVAEYAAEEHISVADAAFDFAGVDEIEGLGIEPISFEVVDLESAVWRSPRPCYCV